MASVEESVSPLTFDIKDELLDRVISFQSKCGARSLSDVVRYAIGSFDFGEFEAGKPAHRQLSVRLPAEQKARLLHVSRVHRVSVGELLRTALDALPNNPLGGFIQKTTQHIAMSAKKPAKKVAAKEDCGCSSKQACAVKAPAKKAAVKAPAKKAVAKKAPAAKAVAKKAPAKKVAVKAPAKKAVAKKAPAKKAPAKKAPAKKIVKK